MKVIFHKSDLDGKCSGAIVKLKYPQVDLVPINHGEVLNTSEFKTGETVFMCDFSLDMDLMYGLNDKYKFIWIDHHISSIRAYEEYRSKNYKPPIEGLRKDGVAACSLTWSYLFPDKVIPIGVKLLGEYDVWNHSNKLTLPFQYGMRSYENWPDAVIWDKIFSGDRGWLSKVIYEGTLLMNQVDRKNSFVCNKQSFDIEFEGYKTIATNRQFEGSRLVGDRIYDYDIVLNFAYMNDKMWHISLYSEKSYVDCSEIASKYGGGGHKGAAGFVCEELPFEL